MTQIAATVASLGAKTAHAGKSHGAKGGAGADFASLAAGLGLPTDDGEMADADGLTLTGEEAGTGAGKSEGKSEGKTGGPVVLDLSLGAAAQSAVTEMVVASAQAPVKAPDTPDLPSAMPKSDTATVLDGMAAGRSGWRRMQDKAVAAVDGKAFKAGADAAVQSAVSTATATPDTGLTTGTQAIMQQVPGQILPQGGDTTKAVSARQRTKASGMQADVAVRQTAAEPAKAAVVPAKAMVDKIDTAPLPPIFSALPQAVSNPKPTPPAATAQPVKGEAADPAQLAVAQLAVTDNQAASTPATGRPVMAALHRTTSVAGEKPVADPANAQALPVADAARTGAETAQDQGGDANAPTLGSDGQTRSTADSISSAGTQFSDILQSLPPIAQSRMGVVADVSPVVTGPGNVGATLQGQVIDMGVDGQWIDRMAKEITALSEGTGHSRFQLNPPNLGRIQIDIQQGETGGQIVRMTTETEGAAQRLRDGKPALEADARMSALSINSVTIERSSAGFDNSRDPNPQQNAQQNPQQSPQRHPQASDQGFGQSSAQTGGQGSQAGSQANAQANSQGQQNSNGQGKGPWSRDVLNERAGTAAQDGGSVRRDGDQLVRYA
ncbi:MAG TPA: flagellar hook-length control protein FliK [Sphingobium sp.]|uniref:flagellar hook-length control protein FliK n=1 Tax=Sphingobium sp. TaxID=1912891 RepID=UPI002ED6BA32